MKLTRRDLLRFAAGSAAGMMFTPIPWKVLDDSAIWTQNWPWIPQPSRGEATQKSSVCTLCGAGCGLRARCIDGMPVSLTGAENHPLGYGTLCAAGLAAHHLAFHPLRARTPLQRTRSHGVIESNSLSVDQAVSTVANALNRNAVVAVLDRRPGRIVSQMYRQWLGSFPGGMYLTPPATENGTLETIRQVLKGSPELGFDFEHASCIVSFGTPLFDCWGSPGRMARLLDAKQKNGSPNIIQIEHQYSRTAMFADTWLPAFPGTEESLALAFLYVLIHDESAGAAGRDAACALLAGGDAVRGLTSLSAFRPEAVASETGIDAETIVSIARTMADKKPAIVLGGGDAGSGPLEKSAQRAIVALNVALGSIGTPGGIVVRTAAPWASAEATPLAPSVSITEVTDHSIDVLLLDGAEDGCWIPWGLVERKLKGDHALVVSLSAFDAGLARHADILIPSPAPLEQWEDLPTPFDAPLTSFAVAAPLMAAPEGTINAADVIRRLSLGTGGGIDGAAPLDLIKARVKQAFDLKRGYVQTGTSRAAVKDLASVDALTDQLGAGGVWFDDANPAKVSLTPERIAANPVVHAAGTPAVLEMQKGKGPSVMLIPCATKGTAGTGQTSPILSKLFQESTLRPYGTHLFVNPATCAGAGINDGDRVSITTACGSATATVHTDATVMPGVAIVPVGPDPEAINQSPIGGGSILACCADNQETWRTTPATLGRA